MTLVRSIAYNRKTCEHVEQAVMPIPEDDGINHYFPV